MTQGAARGRRLDIQGLRGLPVIPTLIYHMTSTPVLTGGVIFLDMFFTVSGFLITSRLLHLARTRTIGGYYWEFYKFRVRRLFPAAIFTILVTAALAYALFVPTRASHVLEDAYSSLFFFANIHFAAQGTDYMHRGISTSPLLPFWSLSVEEQFYVVWPIVILVVLAWAARRERQLRVLVGACLAILVFALTYGWWFSATHHVAAYYDTLSRSGDFAIGALLAVYAGRSTLVPAAQAPRRPGRPRVLAVKARDLANRHAPLLGWSGIAVFAVGTFTTPTSHNFPVPWGLLGALGAGLVIYAGIDQPQRNRLLDNRVLVWLGDVSYSFYVVHFPVMIFAASYLAGDTIMLYVFDTLGSAAATVFVYYFVEEPGRRGLKATWRWFRAGRHHVPVQVLLATAMAATVVFTVTPKDQPMLPLAADATGPAVPVDLGPGHSPSPIPMLPPVHPMSGFVDPYEIPPIGGLGPRIADGAQLRVWPKLSNRDAIENIELPLAECIRIDVKHPPCMRLPRSGFDRAKIAMIFGDSSSLAYLPMVQGALGPRGWTIIQVAGANCSAGLLPSAADVETGCPALHAAYRALVHRWHPALVLLTTAEHISAEAEQLTAGAYVGGLKDAIRQIRAQGSRVAVISAPPQVADDRIPGACLVAGSTPRNCIYTPMQAWYDLNRMDREAARVAGAAYGDPVALFCVNLVCPGVVGDLVVHADSVHITPQYAASLAPSFATWLRVQGLD